MNRAGMTLAELIVALLLLGMALIALVGAAAVGQRTLASAATIERLTLDAATVIDSLAAQPAPAAGTRTHEGITLTWRVSSDSAGMRLHVDALAYDGARPITASFEARHAPR